MCNIKLVTYLCLSSLLCKNAVDTKDRIVARIEWNVRTVPGI